MRRMSGAGIAFLWAYQIVLRQKRRAHNSGGQSSRLVINALMGRPRNRIRFGCYFLVTVLGWGSGTTPVQKQRSTKNLTVDALRRLVTNCCINLRTQSQRQRTKVEHKQRTLVNRHLRHRLMPGFWSASLVASSSMINQIVANKQKSEKNGRNCGIASSGRHDRKTLPASYRQSKQTDKIRHGIKQLACMILPQRT
jgi:hypothetical protein